MNALRRTAIVLIVALIALILVACSSLYAKESAPIDTASTLTSSLTITSTVTILTPQETCVPNTQQPTTTVVDDVFSPSTDTPSTAETTAVTPLTTITKPIPTVELTTTQVPEVETTPSVITTVKPLTTEPIIDEPVITAPAITEPPTTEELPTEYPTTEDVPSWDISRKVIHYKDFKAIWISQYDLYGIYTNKGVQRSKEDFTKRIQVVLDNVQQMGFNTVILQVRPNADSMYPSAIYPMCQYVVGKYGVSADYDPVDIIVEEAHKRSISIHAWINPLRAMTDDEILLVDNCYTIRKWHDDPEKNGTYLVLYKGRYYLNPAYEEVRELIISGALEVLAQYEFDGLHMDDYFYPTTAQSFDFAAYDAYIQSGGEMDLSSFRHNQINELVAGLYQATKSIHPELKYGISPAGNYDYAYASQYADFYTWCANDGYIDYICPQIYYGLEHQIYPFGGICEIFNDMIKVDSVDLIIGMAFGKAQSQTDLWAGTGANEWKENKDVMKRSLEYTASLEHCTGIAVFCYQYFYHPITGVPEDDIAEERDNFLPVLKDIAWQTAIE